MPVNEKLINDVSALTKELDGRDISHEDLGKLGFADAQQSLQEICTTVGPLLDRLAERLDKVNTTLANDVLVQVRAQLKDVREHVNQIDVLASQVTQAGDYAQRRDQAISYFENAVQMLQKTIFPLDTDLKVGELTDALSAETYQQDLAKAHKRTEAILASAQESAKQLDSLLSATRAKSATSSVEIASTGFAELRDTHTAIAKWWFWAMIVFGALTIAAVVYVLFGPSPANSIESWIPYVFKRLLLISAPVAGLKICLSKFNLERNLQIVYDHRQTVLDQYPVFDSAIADDDAKNQFRLEVAKFIFSDPTTGYVGQKSASELNINPVMGAVEKAVAK
jgi:hypothetical protein